MVQDDEIGDGTTGVVVLAGALLEEAEKLLDRVCDFLFIWELHKSGIVLMLMYVCESRCYVGGDGVVLFEVNDVCAWLTGCSSDSYCSWLRNGLRVSCETFGRSG